MAEQWQTLQIPLAQGMTQKTDERALPPPALAVVKDAIFSDAGGLQPRVPYTNERGNQYNIPASSSFGTLPPDVRRLVANGSELLAFTKDRLYSWANAASCWVDKGEHPAVVVDETPVFETTSDQTQCDRAELASVVVYVWRDEANPTSGGSGPAFGPGGHPPAALGGSVYIAAIDRFLGTVILSPTEIPNEARPRLIALPGVHYVVLFTINASTGDLLYRRIRITGDVIDADVAAAPTTVFATDDPALGTYSGAFDCCAVSASTAAFAWNFSTKSIIGSIHQNNYTWGTVGGSTPTVVTHFGLETSDGPIAVCVTPDAASLMVVRTDNLLGATPPEVRYDLWTISTGAGVRANQLIAGSATTSLPASQITAAFSDVAVGGDYVASIWWSTYAWSFTDDTIASGTTWLATVTQIAGTVVAPTVFAQGLAVASRAFCRVGTGHTYVHLVFSEDNRIDAGRTAQLQNTYFIYRDDGRLCGQIAPDVAGGFEHDTVYQSIVGHLPNVVRIDARDRYAWCAQRRRRIPLAQAFDSAYSARSPLDAIVYFDDNRARRCVRLGETLYITGSEVMQYDGEQLVELGFHLYPWRLQITPQTILGPGAGVVPPGKYTYKSTYRWDNARGERERSTTAAYYTLDTTASISSTNNNVVMPSLGVTHKRNTRSPVIVEAWRTTINPGDIEDPMYLATSLDPRDAFAGISNGNRFVANDLTSPTVMVHDNMTDAILIENEENEEVGAVLESLAPPPCTVICASQSRLFIAGIAADPNRVWYSKYRAAGRLAAFDELLTIDIPPAGGAITALAVMAEMLVVFRASAIYLVPGEGLSDTGEGQNYGPARVVSPDTGAVSAEAVALTALGLVFKSSKGWYLLPPNGVPQYIGAAIADYDSETVLATHVIESDHHVRIVSAQRFLVWDYLVNQWSEWSETNATTACVLVGQHTWWSSSDGDWLIEQVGGDFDYSLATFGLDVETPWIKLNDIAGRGRVRRLLITGEWRSAHKLRIRVARDYKHVGGEVAWFDDVLWSPTTAIAGDAEQVRHGPSIQRCGAIKVRVTAVGAASVVGGIVPAVAGEGLHLTGIALEVGVEPGLKLNLSAAQKG